MREPRPKQKQRKDFFLKLTLAQLLLCALLFAVVFFAMKTNGAFFTRLREEFLALTAEDHDLNDVTFFPPAETQSAAARAAGEGETTQPLPESETAQAAEETGAGGEDIMNASGLKLVSFACYSTADTPVLPVAGHVTSEFGERVHPIYGTVSFHSGKDLAAPEGSPIYAALDGEVIAAGVGEMSGNYVKLRHENGLETLYCHCSGLNVETGIRVRKGDVIAFVGQTGLATGPHLHFEVHIDGVKRDPDYLLENAAGVAWKRRLPSAGHLSVRRFLRAGAARTRQGRSAVPAAFRRAARVRPRRRSAGVRLQADHADAAARRAAAVGRRLRLPALSPPGRGGAGGAAVQFSAGRGGRRGGADASRCVPADVCPDQSAAGRREPAAAFFPGRRHGALRAGRAA